MLDIIAYNIRSAENIGSLIRTMDSLGAHKIWLAGYTSDIDNSKLQKTALGAEKVLLSEKVLNIDEVWGKLKDDGFKIIGLELDRRAVLLKEQEWKDENIALLIGNEVDGIPEILRNYCDQLVYIEQKGIKKSMNVTIATSIAMWEILKNN